MFNIHALKVAVKVLASEGRACQQQISTLRRTRPPKRHPGRHLHGIAIQGRVAGKQNIRFEARFKLLAYAFARGRPYAKTERKTGPHNAPSAAMIAHYLLPHRTQAAPVDLIDQIKAWLAARAVHLTPVSRHAIKTRMDEEYKDDEVTGEVHAPRNDLVLILPDEAEKMKGRIHVPDSYRKPQTRGTVIAVGPGYLLADGTRSDMDLKVDDRVEFLWGPATPVVEIDGEIHFVLKEVEVLTVVSGEPELEMEMPDEDEDEDEDDDGPPQLKAG